LQHHYNEYLEANPKKRHLHCTGYVSSEAMQVYANVYKCMFVLVQPVKSSRGSVEIIQILAADEYMADHPLYVINVRGQAFDYYEPISKNGLSAFDTAFRSVVEVLIIYFHKLCK
jgi:hypothetical protein